MDDRSCSSRSHDGDHHLWMIDADGGAPRRVTDDAGDQRCPDMVPRRAMDLLHLRRWDRAWCLASAGDRRSQHPPHAQGHGRAGVGVGGRQPPVLRNRSGAMVRAGRGRSPHEVIKCVKGGAIAVAASGIYYASCNFELRAEHGAPRHGPRHETRSADRHNRRLHVRLEVSPDEKTICTTRLPIADCTNASAWALTSS